MNIYELQATLTLDIGAFREAAAEAGALFSALSEEIGSASGNMAEKTDGIAGALGEIASAAGECAGAMADGFARTAEAAEAAVSAGEAAAGVFGETIPAAAQSALSAVAALPGEFSSLGAEMASGLGSGFSSVWDGIAASIGKRAADLVANLKDLLGIRSPSRVFAEIGADMARGVRVGWDAVFPDFERSAGGDLSSLAGGRRPGAGSAAVDRVGFEDSALGRSSAAEITSFLSASSLGGTSAAQPIEIRLLLDGNTAAEALVDPLRRTALRRDISGTGGGRHA